MNIVLEGLGAYVPYLLTDGFGDYSEPSVPGTSEFSSFIALSPLGWIGL